MSQNNSAKKSQSQTRVIKLDVKDFKNGKGESVYSDQDIDELYAWINAFEFSKPRVNFHKDFSDGKLVSELINHCFPGLIENHNYSYANSALRKRSNWTLLNRKIFQKLSFSLSDAYIESLINGTQGAIEKVLFSIKSQKDDVDAKLEKTQFVEVWDKVDWNSLLENFKYIDITCFIPSGQNLKDEDVEVKIIEKTYVPKRMLDSKNEEILAKAEFLDSLIRRTEVLQERLKEKDEELDAITLKIHQLNSAQIRRESP